LAHIDASIPALKQRDISFPPVRNGREREARGDHDGERHQRPPPLGPDEPRQQDQRVRLDEYACGDETAGCKSAPVPDRDHGAQKQQAERQVELTERQFLDQKLAIQEQGQPQQR